MHDERTHGTRFTSKWDQGKSNKQAAVAKMAGALSGPGPDGRTDRPETAAPKEPEPTFPHPTDSTLFGKEKRSFQAEEVPTEPIIPARTSGALDAIFPVTHMFGRGPRS